MEAVVIESNPGVRPLKKLGVGAVDEPRQFKTLRMIIIHAEPVPLKGVAAFRQSVVVNADQNIPAGGPGGPWPVVKADVFRAVAQ